MMKLFLEALRESIITQAILTLLIVGTTCYLVIAGQPVPEWLLQTTLLVFGFFFGSKAGFAQGKSSMLPFIPKRKADRAVAVKR